MVEQKGTNNNIASPAKIAKATDNITPAHQLKQKSQLNIFAKNALPWTCTHSITPHLRNKVMQKPATNAITNMYNINRNILFNTYFFNTHFARKTPTAIRMH